MSSRAITVVGGGISGLSAAYHLSRRFPPRSGTRITLVDKSPRLGGWVHSERVHVRDNAGNQAAILLESGPRTLRPNSKAIMELIHLLNLTPSVQTVLRDAPAARNRFLHLPSADGLQTIPASIFSLMRSPLAKLLLPAVIRDARRRNGKILNASSPVGDESVDGFFTRHFGPEFARTFGSALVHGIYAADSRLLSIRAAFPAVCRLEESGNGSVVRGALRDMLGVFRKKPDKSIKQHEEYELGEVARLMQGVSVYSFQDGMQMLTDAMASRLEAQENVTVMKGENAAELLRRDDTYEVTTESGKRLSSSHLIIAIPLPRLHSILANSSKNQTDTSALPLLPHLLANPSSSVTVVNLVFPPSATPIHPEGFGYLIPRPSDAYPTSSLGMLGTVFDSCALSAQDHQHSGLGSAPHFTKLTVMLGGPYGTPSPPSSSAEFLPTLLDTLRQHLGRTEPLPEPCAVRVREHADCIPTPTVGHVARMEELKAAVREQWGPRATVIGAGVGGVSLGDCVESGRRAALGLEI